MTRDSNDERARRYAEALGWRRDIESGAIRAMLDEQVQRIMAVADAEQAELRAESERLRGRCLPNKHIAFVGRHIVASATVRAEKAEAALVRFETMAQASSPCCNYREELDAPCTGTAWLFPNSPTYVCDTCGGRCGRFAHPSCTPAAS